MQVKNFQMFNQLLQKSILQCPTNQPNKKSCLIVKLKGVFNRALSSGVKVWIQLCSCFQVSKTGLFLSRSSRRPGVYKRPRGNTTADTTHYTTQLISCYWIKCIWTPYTSISNWFCTHHIYVAFHKLSTSPPWGSWLNRYYCQIPIVESLN